MGEAKRLIKNTGIIAIGGMATKIVQFLLLPLYTSVLSTSEYGTVDYLNTIALFCVPAVSLLMDEALFRFLIDCDTEKGRKQVMSTSCIVFLAGAVTMAVCAAIVWMIFRPENLGWIIGLVLSGCVLQMMSAVLRGCGDTIEYALMNFLAGILTVVLNITFLTILNWGVTGMLASTVFGQGGVAAAFFLLKKTWHYFSLRAFDLRLAKELVFYSIPLIPNKVSWTIMNLADRLVIVNTLGTSAAGVYAIAYKIPNFMDTVNGFFYQAWRESSARALRLDEENDSFFNAVYRAYRRFAMGVVLLLTAFTPAVYGLLIESSYAEGLIYIPVLLLSMYLSNMSGFYGGIFTAHRDTSIMGTTTLVSAVVCLILCLVLIPIWGLWGATAATLVATFIVNEYRRIKVRRHVVLHEDSKEQVLTLVSVVAVFSLFYLSLFFSSLLLYIVMAILSLLYFMLMNKDVLLGAARLIKERMHSAD